MIYDLEVGREDLMGKKAFFMQDDFKVEKLKWESLFNIRFLNNIDTERNAK